MDNVQSTSLEGIQNNADMSNERTFTQDDVNRIVKERLAKEKSKGNEDVEKRMAELDKRERRMNAVQKLRDNGLPDYLVDALNMDTDEAFEQSLEAIKKMKGENHESLVENSVGTVIGHGTPIGVVSKANGTDPIRKAFGL